MRIRTITYSGSIPMLKTTCIWQPLLSSQPKLCNKLFRLSLHKCFYTLWTNRRAQMAQKLKKKILGDSVFQWARYFRTLCLARCIINILSLIFKLIKANSFVCHHQRSDKISAIEQISNWCLPCLTVRNTHQPWPKQSQLFNTVYINRNWHVLK